MKKASTRARCSSAFMFNLEGLSKDFKTGMPWQSLLADDLVSVLEWKNRWESKGLRVIMPRTKFTASGPDLDVMHDSGNYPGTICRTGIGKASIQCTKVKF